MSLRYGISLSLLAACHVYQPALLEGSQGSDRVEPAVCVAHDERCNGVDDDCDGTVDEDEGADQLCVLMHARSRCVDGACILDSCEMGYLNCNDSAADGCEKARAERLCGECGRVCESDRRGVSVAEQDAGADTTAQPARAGAEVAAAGRVANQPAVTGDVADMDAGSPCVPAPERCDGLDNDCDGAIDEDSSCSCGLDNPSGQGAACDTCACRSCQLQLAACFADPETRWNDACRKVVACYGKNTLAGNCLNGDCNVAGLGVCANEVNVSSTWADAYSCSIQPGRARTPCDAWADLRQCMRERCSPECNVGN